jgi:hypothetical protein
LRSGIAWTIGFVALFVIGALGRDGLTAEELDRLWMTIAFGFGMAVVLYTVHWLSPSTVDSGPRGIIRVKGGSITLFPWGAIRGYQIRMTEHGTALVLTLAGTSQPAVLLVPET